MNQRQTHARKSRLCSLAWCVYRMMTPPDVLCPVRMMTMIVRHYSQPIIAPDFVIWRATHVCASAVVLMNWAT